MPVVAVPPDLPVGVEVLNDEMKAMRAAEAASVAGRALRGVLSQAFPHN
jgi:hypothetical protein